MDEPQGMIPHLIATADTPVSPGAPRLPGELMPAPIGYVGYITPEAMALADTSDLPSDGVTLWVIDEGGSYHILKPGKYRLKPTLQELKMGVEGKIVSFVYPWQFQEKVDEVIEQDTRFTFENHRITRPVSEEDARWIISTHPNVQRDTLPTWALCPFHIGLECPFVSKNQAVMDTHIRQAHG